ncbi:MAG: tRNA lysidine(34) synthetase TilS [Nitrospirae bacterium]|nr:MAG: tRNA lysidine(34) synthetase TilS [Nitrospirota bacterium]
MRLPDRIKATIKKYSMLVPGDRLLVGLSGGPDSVCLLTALCGLQKDLGTSVSAAYINHGLRPGEIPAEIAFCTALCTRLGVPFTVKAIEVKTYASTKKKNLQEAARELRYAAFDEIMAETGANKLALGHNADDQAETMLMRLFRGSGMTGLSGIPPVRNSIVRPLIETERTEIEKFLSDENLKAGAHSGLSYVIDSSNLKDEYLRNKIRRHILPELKKHNTELISTLARTADIMRDEERYLELLVTKTLMRLISRKNDMAIELFTAPLEALDTVLLRRALRRAVDETASLRGIGFINIEDMTALIKKGRAGDRLHFHGGIRVIKGYSTVKITSEAPARLGSYKLDKNETLPLTETGLVLQASVVSSMERDPAARPKDTAFFNADMLKFPLTVRPRKSGDFFYPAGFGKKKKLQDFFVDEKVPRDERDAVPIVASGDDIIWVAGYRADERHKVDKSTGSILKLQLKPLKI